MPDWSERKHEPLGFPKRYNTPGLSQREREMRATAKRRWLRKHDASFREAERAKRREWERNQRKACPTCGRLVSRKSTRCQECARQENNRAVPKPERLWLELNTPYQNGSNTQHEDNVRRLNQIAKERPL